MSDQCMSVADIAHWVQRLLQNESWGWTRDERLLARFLGFQKAWRMRKFLWGDWHLSVKLQRVVAAQLARVLAGEVVCERRLFGTGPHQRIVSEAVIADRPRPLDELGPLRAVVSVGRNGVKLTVKPPPMIGSARAMPSFTDIWERL